MYHNVKFLFELVLDLEISPKQWLQMLHIKEGTTLRAQTKCYVVDTEDEGPIEVGDLFFEDGSIARAVRCECFSFVDE